MLLELGQPVSASQGTSYTATLTILDDDASPTVQFDSAAYTTTESAGSAPITTTLSAVSSLTVTVQYSTTDGTALQASDYTALSGTLTFAPGVITQTFNVSITADSADEPDETVFLVLTNAVNATLGTPFTTTLTILDDDESAAGGVISYTYDALYRLTRADYADGSYFAYAYDAVGNRTSEVACWGGASCTPITTTYSYDDANRLTAVNGLTYTWDANGNLLADGTFTYTYDAANRLITATNGITVSGFTYSGLGDRVGQVVAGVVTTYTLDLAAGLTQVLADGEFTYLYGQGRIAQFDGADFDYFLGDALGSVRQLADENGEVTLARRYEPYGDMLESEGTGETSYGFAAENFDEVTGLLFLRARFMQPATGRFIHRDTWAGDHARPQSLNRWTYSLANPISYTDPSGHTPVTNTYQLNWDAALLAGGADGVIMGGIGSFTWPGLFMAGLNPGLWCGEIDWFEGFMPARTLSKQAEVVIDLVHNEIAGFNSVGITEQLFDVVSVDFGSYIGLAHGFRYNQTLDDYEGAVAVSGVSPAFGAAFGPGFGFGLVETGPIHGNLYTGSQPWNVGIRGNVNVLPFSQYTGQGFYTWSLSGEGSAGVGLESPFPSSPGVAYYWKKWGPLPIPAGITNKIKATLRSVGLTNLP